MGAIGGTTVSDVGIMTTLFLNDATPVPGTAVFLGGIAHHQDGSRYVALWPGAGIVHWHGGIALRPDGAMVIDPAGSPTNFSGGTGLTFRGEVVASTSATQVTLGGFGHRNTGAMCMSAVA